MIKRPALGECWRYLEPLRVGRKDMGALSTALPHQEEGHKGVLHVSLLQTLSQQSTAVLWNTMTMTMMMNAHNDNDDDNYDSNIKGTTKACFPTSTLKFMKRKSEPKAGKSAREQWWLWWQYDDNCNFDHTKRVAEFSTATHAECHWQIIWQIVYSWCLLCWFSVTAQTLEARTTDWIGQPSYW